jgi:hypothetical protein
MLPSRQKLLASTALLLFIATILCFGAPKSAFKSQAAAADSFQKKIEFIQTNAAASRPDPKPVVFAEEEINAYFAERRLKMPEGVKTVVFDLKPNQVTATTRVDFEQLRQSRPSANPLLSIFDGMHDCQVVAHTEPAGLGMVHVKVESVVIDGVTVPRMALQMFVDHYVKPKYPNVGLDNDYRLPARIESATIADQQGTTIQK